MYPNQRQLWVKIYEWKCDFKRVMCLCGITCCTSYMYEYGIIILSIQVKHSIKSRFYHFRGIFSYYTKKKKKHKTIKMDKTFFFPQKKKYLKWNPAISWIKFQRLDFSEVPSYIQKYKMYIYICFSIAKTILYSFFILPIYNTLYTLRK